MRGLIAAIIGVGVLAGCRCHQKASRVEPVIPRGEPPRYADVAASYNTRVDPLVRLWCRTVVRLKFVDAEGEPQNHQVEGFLQFVKPSKALVTFHKVGQVLALFGSDGDRYWWIETGKNARAFVGRHDRATPERIASAGLRVHPLDLMELMGLTPLPAEGGMTSWSKDGRWIILTLPGRIGERRLSINPETFEPGHVEIVSSGGKVLAASDLAAFERLYLRGAGPDVPRPSVPTKVEVVADDGATRIIMNLSEPQDDPARFPPVAFDFERLVKANGVAQITNLDERGTP